MDANLRLSPHGVVRIPHGGIRTEKPAAVNVASDGIFFVIVKLAPATGLTFPMGDL